jgi:hypothetical protein
MYLRASGTFSGEALVQRATETLGEDRAQSLAYRINAENIMSAHALERPWFGYGHWDPEHPKRPGWMVYDPDTGKKAAIVDGMWVLTLCINGLVGLFTFTTSILLPVLLLRFRVPPRWWGHPMAAPAAACAVMVALHMCDNLLNAMLNPIFICAIGAVAALGVKDAQRHGFPVAQKPTARYARRPMMPNTAAMPRAEPARPAGAGVLNP